jgi:hypothetical protein
MNKSIILRALGLGLSTITLAIAAQARPTDDNAPQWTSQYWVGGIQSGAKDFWEVDFYKKSAPDTPSDIVTCTDSRSRPKNAQGAQFYVHRRHPGSAHMFALLQDAADENARVSLAYEQVNGVCWVKWVSVQYLRPKRAK